MSVRILRRSTVSPPEFTHNPSMCMIICTTGNLQIHCAISEVMPIFCALYIILCVCEVVIPSTDDALRLNTHTSSSTQFHTSLVYEHVHIIQRKQCSLHTKLKFSTAWLSKYTKHIYVGNLAPLLYPAFLIRWTDIDLCLVCPLFPLLAVKVLLFIKHQPSFLRDPSWMNVCIHTQAHTGVYRESAGQPS